MILNYVWLGFFIVAFIAICFQLFVYGNTEILQQFISAIFDAAKNGFEISIGLTGVMCLWLGLVKIGEHSGLIGALSKVLSPFLGRFFPDIPKDHPALGQIALNFSANMLGMDNAATPLGLKAMNSLQELNPNKDIASNSQIMFLVLNTAGLTLIPVTVFLYRTQEHAANPTDVYLPIVLTTFFGTLAGLLSVSLIQKINLFHLRVILPLGLFIVFFGGILLTIYQVPKNQMEVVSSVAGNGLLILVIMTFLISGIFKKLNVFEIFIEGAKEGFGVAIKIIPYLVGILISVAAFRVSGAMDFCVNGIAMFFHLLGLRTDFVAALPTGIMKSMSGGGARAMMIETMHHYGADSMPGRIVSIFQGSSDTTIYILAVYFGSVGIKKTRYALACGLFADAVAVISGIIIAYLFFS
ncbi:MAG: nucleoside recognition domain-containing protein [Bacteroidota bacterium]|jgi:spore maturation protein SpmA